MLQYIHKDKIKTTVSYRNVMLEQQLTIVMSC